jgi:hypothetical protein
LAVNRRLTTGAVYLSGWGLGRPLGGGPPGFSGGGGVSGDARGVTERSGAERRRGTCTGANEGRGEGVSDGQERAGGVTDSKAERRRSEYDKQGALGGGRDGWRGI